MGFDGGYSIVKVYVSSRKMDLNEKAKVRFETMPGKQGQMDWGFFGDHLVYEDGKWKKLYCFLMILGYSRMRDNFMVGIKYNSKPHLPQLLQDRSAEYGAASSHLSAICLYGSIFVGFGSLATILHFFLGVFLHFSTGDDSVPQLSEAKVKSAKKLRKTSGIVWFRRFLYGAGYGNRIIRASENAVKYSQGNPAFAMVFSFQRQML